MAVPLVSESKPRTPFVDGPMGFSASRLFTVVALSEPDALDVLYSETLVRKGQRWDLLTENEDLKWLVCQEIRVQRMTNALDDNTALFECEAIYSYSRDPQPIRAPRSKEVSISYERGSTTETVDLDKDGKPLRTLSNEPIESSRLFPSRVMVLQWYREHATIELAEQFYSQYEGKINAADFYGVPIHCAYCESITPEQMRWPDWDSIEWFRMTARIQIRPQKMIPGQGMRGGWEDWKLHRGFRTRGGIVDGKRQYPFIVDGGQRVTEPRPLDANGQQIDDPDAGNLHYLRFDLHEEINFMAMLP